MFNIRHQDTHELLRARAGVLEFPSSAAAARHMSEANLWTHWELAPAVMENADYLAFCKGPENGGYFEYSNPHVKGRAPTHHGMGGANILRVIEDWFPVGEAFQFLGSSCFSRGPVRDESQGFGWWMLSVLCKGPGGTLEERTFSVREVLSMAKQISVDRCNALAELA